jgi:uncharacterized protein (DUF427 family)
MAARAAGRNPNGKFLVPAMPERVLYAEPLRRRLRADLGGGTVVQSDHAVLLFEPGRYPGRLLPADRLRRWRAAAEQAPQRTPGPRRDRLVRGHRRRAPGAARRLAACRAARHAAILERKVALAWRAMDGFYEEDDRILGHAADPYHRIDIRRTSRRLVVRAGDRVVADTASPLVLYESGFAPRWYVPRSDVVAEALVFAQLQTFCPYKGIASFYDIDGIRQAAWSYHAPYDEMAVIGDLVSLEPDKVVVTLDDEVLELEPGQNVTSHGIDRNLSIDEAGALLSGAAAS